MVVHDACPLRKETGGQTRKTALKVLNHSTQYAGLLSRRFPLFPTRIHHVEEKTKVSTSGVSAGTHY
ncbi:hypothetical protein DTO280E4_58 [Paecilomyces variotii]|nr:hypothetical protein DTO217A2_4118 [Paecilomyces variotii]KAJ9365762.1 hypothetical protein DTO280E4_58 [Paecilomyces variotii]